MNDLKPTIEQRVAQLESNFVNAANLLRSVCANYVVLADAILNCKNDCIQLIGQQGDMLKMFLTQVPDDDDFKAEILTMIRRGETEMEQKEALFADLQNQMELLKQKLPKPILPENPPPAG
jgi:hypothetical protein